MKKNKFFSSIIIINILLFFLSIIQLRFKPIYPKFVNQKIILDYIESFSQSHKINNKKISFDKFFLSEIYLLLDNKDDWYVYSSISTLDMNSIDIEAFKKKVSEILDANNIYRNKIYEPKKVYSDGYVYSPDICFNGTQKIKLVDLKNEKFVYKKKLLVYWNNLINPFSSEIYSCILRSKLY